jgi:hypothetical protein
MMVTDRLKHTTIFLSVFPKTMTGRHPPSKGVCLSVGELA